MRKFWITFNFYAKEHFTKKALIWFGIFMIAPIVVFWAIDQFGGGSYDEIAIVQNSSEFMLAEEMFADIERVQLHFVDEARARALFEDGTIDEIFIISGQERPELRVESANLDGHFEVQMMIEQLLTMAHIEALMLSYDLPAEVVAELITPIMVEMEITDFEDQIAVELVNLFLPMAVYMVVLMTGQMVANSVASEKTSRVMEVMLGKVHPTYTMVSKVLSSLVGFLMPFIALVLGAVIAHIIGIVDLGMIGEIINEFFPVTALILIAVVLILGYFCFIFLFAAAGAIANSVESLTSTLQPLTMATVVPFFLVMFIGVEGVVMDILVYVPFISPYVLVQRYLLGTSGMVEVFVAVGLMIAFSILTLVVSARLYMNGISHTAEKVTLKDLKKMLTK